jgi:hypothetical protein
VTRKMLSEFDNMIKWSKSLLNLRKKMAYEWKLCQSLEQDRR